jgi:putative methyltransferase (TIGR04325 family)
MGVWYSMRRFRAPRVPLLTASKALVEDRSAALISREEWLRRDNAGYDGALVAEFCAARAKLWVESGERGPALPGMPILALACSSLGGKAAILDFGGGAGMLGLSLRKYFPHLVARYVVVEVGPMVEAAAKAWLPFVQFVNEIPTHNFDVVVSSGTLQYVAEPERTLTDLVALRAPRLLLLRGFFTAEPRYLRQKAPLFNHGAGPLPSGFADCTLEHFLRTLSPERYQTIVNKFYKIDFTLLNASGLPMSDPSFIGEDWYCSLRCDE